MKKDFAIEAKGLALEALQKLHAVLSLEADWNPEDMQELAEALGVFIGEIDAQILCSIYRQFPELTNLSVADDSQT